MIFISKEREITRMRYSSIRILTAALTALIAVAAGCRVEQSPVKQPDDAAEAFLDTFGEKKYEQALAIADAQLRQDKTNGLFYFYRGAPLVMLGRYKEAVQAYRRGESFLPSDFYDRTSLYLRALALYHLRMYKRSQLLLDTLSRVFPASQLNEQARRLALKIEDGLSTGVNQAVLNWYIDQGLRAYESGMPALAIEYLEEYRLLAQEAEPLPKSVQYRSLVSLAGAYLELGQPEHTKRLLEQVPQSYGDYRAGMLLALACKKDGDMNSALQILRNIAKNASDEQTKEKALNLINNWE